MPDEWQFIAVLPNVNLANSIDARVIALVPRDDDRMTPLRENKSVVRLLDKFIDQFGNRIAPSVLIRRADAPATVNGEAILAFRNSVAVSSVVQG